MTTIAQTVGDGLARALRWSAAWAGLPDEAVNLEMNRDFLPEILSAQDLRALLELWQGGAISHDDVIANLKRGDVVAAGKRADEVRAARAGEAV